MVERVMDDTATPVVQRAKELESHGHVREAIDLLTNANRSAPEADIELALMRIRRERARPLIQPPSADRERIVSDGSDGGLFEVAAADLSVATLRAGWA